jgi:hypothetical protein
MLTATINFTLGEVVVTASARSILRFSGETPEAFLARHQRGDWGDVTPEEWFENDAAAACGMRVWSAYLTAMLHMVWVITEGDRRFTRVLATHEF